MFCEAIRKRGVRGFRSVVALAGRKGGERRCNGGRELWLRSSLREPQEEREAGSGSAVGVGGGEVGWGGGEGMARGTGAGGLAWGPIALARPRAEVGDQEADFDAVAEGEPMETEFD